MDRLVFRTGLCNGFQRHDGSPVISCPVVAQAQKPLSRHIPREDLNRLPHIIDAPGVVLFAVVHHPEAANGGLVSSLQGKGRPEVALCVGLIVLLEVDKSRQGVKRRLGRLVAVLGNGPAQVIVRFRETVFLEGPRSLVVVFRVNPVGPAHVCRHGLVRRPARPVSGHGGSRSRADHLLHLVDPHGGAGVCREKLFEEVPFAWLLPHGAGILFEDLVQVPVCAQGVVRVVALAAHVGNPEPVCFEFVIAAVFEQQELSTQGAQPHHGLTVVIPADGSGRNAQGQPQHHFLRHLLRRVFRRDVADLVPHDIGELPLVFQPGDQPPRHDHMTRNGPGIRDGAVLDAEGQRQVRPVR